MKNHLLIVCDDKEKTLSLALPNNLPEGIIVGPYIAMYKYIYEEYSWTNWFDWYEKNIKLENIKDGTAKYISESYVNSVIMYAEADEDLIWDIVDELGYMPNYFYVLEKGEIELINIEHMDYECGKGMYFYDRDNFEDDRKPDLIYEGEYLRCVLDKNNNIKSGQINPKEQEILIPFHIRF